MTRVTYTAAQVAALFEQGRQDAVKAAAEMHAELLAHLERVPANAIVLLAPADQKLYVEDDWISIRSAGDQTDTSLFKRFGKQAGAWSGYEQRIDANGRAWNHPLPAMRPDDFGTLFEVRP